MMTPSNGNIFRVTDPLCGKFTGHRWIPVTKARDTEIIWFFPNEVNWEYYVMRIFNAIYKYDIDMYIYLFTINHYVLHLFSSLTSFCYHSKIFVYFPLWCNPVCTTGVTMTSDFLVLIKEWRSVKWYPVMSSDILHWNSCKFRWYPPQ